MSITQERKAELITEFGKNGQDSGSASVPVALVVVKAGAVCPVRVLNI